MNKKKITHRLSKVIAEVGVSAEIGKPAEVIAEYIYMCLGNLIWLNEQDNLLIAPDMELPITTETELQEDTQETEFIDRMYALYPTRCPKRNCSLGKSKRDKTRIKALLKTYTPEQIEQVIRHEVDSNYDVNYMKNFSTLLNNFPDPDTLSSVEQNPITQSKPDEVIYNGIVYK